MIHGLPIAAPACPCAPAQRWVAQPRCILPFPLLPLTPLLSDSWSQTTSPSPSPEPLPPPSDHSRSASRPLAHVSLPSPQH